MRARYLTLCFFSITIFAAILVLRAAGSPPQSTVLPADPSLERLTPVAPVEVRVDPSEFISPTAELEIPEDLTIKEGQALLENHCTRCHTTHWLDQTEKSREEWEQVLARMEMMGLRLEEPEKATLLDYLATTEQP